MPVRLHAVGRIALAALLGLCLPACERGTPGTGAPIGVAVKPQAQAARKPVEAVNVLRDRLLARDGAGFARLAVPPDLHARLAALVGTVEFFAIRQRAAIVHFDGIRGGWLRPRAVFE